MRAGEGQNRQEEEGMLSQMCWGGSQALPEIWEGIVQHRNGCRPQGLLTRQRNSMSREEVHLCDELEEVRRCGANKGAEEGGLIIQGK